MEFKTFVQKLYRAIGCETTEADFVFDVLSSILSDKYIEKDQILPLPYKGGGRMLRYYFAGDKSISNLAKKMIRYVDASNFAYFLDNEFENQPELVNNVIEEFSDEIPNIDNENYPEELGTLLANIMFEAARRAVDIPDDEYNKLRHALYEEAQGVCPITGRNLLISGVESFRVVKIDYKMPLNFDNTIALSPRANQAYFSNGRKNKRKELEEIKNNYYEKQRIRMLLDDSFYNNKIKEVIEKIDSNPTVLDVELTLKPTEFKNKIPRTSRLFSKISPLIADYYLFLRGLFSYKDGTDFSFADFCKKIRANYLRLANFNLSQEKIFDLLVENLSRKLKADLLPCEIVISFFIQNCEVFDEISK